MENNRGGRRRISGRRGVFLYVVFFLTLVVCVLVFAFQAFMMSETQVSKQIMAGEVAYHMARAGVGAGIAYFRNTKSPCELCTALLTKPADQVNDMCFYLCPATHDPLQDLVAPYGNDADLSVELKLMKFKPLFTGTRSPSGIEYNDLEKMGVLRVRAVAEYQSKRRILVAYKRVKVITPLPYVVSKFTLMARRLLSNGNDAAGTNHLNQLQIEPDGHYDAKRMSVSKPLGLMTLTHGAMTEVEDRGWVFLGTRGLRMFNLAWGRGKFGEEHHLLKRPFELAEGSAPTEPGHRLRFWQKGMFTNLKTHIDMYDHYPLGTPTSDPLLDRCTLLQLFGTYRDPSATIALGQLYRRFLMMRYLFSGAHGRTATLPWAVESEWVKPYPRPWETQPPYDVKEEAFAYSTDVSASFQSYKACMATFFEEAYNRSVDHILATGGGMNPPRRLVNPQRVQHRFGDPDFLYAPDKNTGHVRVCAQAGRVLFNGNLAEIRSDTNPDSDEMVVAKRAVHVAEPEGGKSLQQVFEEFLKDDPKKIPGILYFKGAGGIRINKALSLFDGGILATDGDIVVEAPTSVGPLGHALVLLSLNGNVDIRTDKVQASLVALNGTIKKRAGADVEIEGNVVVGDLDPEVFLAGGGDVKVNYDDRLDVTRPTKFIYCVNMAPEREFYQER